MKQISTPTARKNAGKDKVPASKAPRGIAALRESLKRRKEAIDAENAAKGIIVPEKPKRKRACKKKAVVDTKIERDNQQKLFYSRKEKLKKFVKKMYLDIPGSQGFFIIISPYNRVHTHSTDDFGKLVPHAIKYAQDVFRDRRNVTLIIDNEESEAEREPESESGSGSN